MIKSVTVTNHLGNSLHLVLKSPETSGFFVRSITGLGPVKGTINLSEVSGSDGAVYNSARATSRNIVFDLGYLNTSAIEETRHLSYEYFPIKRVVGITIETDIRTVRTYGYVESNTVNIFSKDQGSIISVLCPDSYFYSVETSRTIFSGSLALFEFPFENASLTSNLIEFGSLSTNSENNVVYTGDAPVGIVISIHMLGRVVNPRVINTKTQEVMGLVGEFRDGDDVVISTITGSKFVYLQRDGQQYNILNMLDKYATWFKLERGDNFFAYLTDAGASSLEFKIDHQIAYEGL